MHRIRVLAWLFAVGLGVLAFTLLLREDALPPSRVALSATDGLPSSPRPELLVTAAPPTLGSTSQARAALRHVRERLARARRLPRTRLPQLARTAGWIAFLETWLRLAPTQDDAEQLGRIGKALTLATNPVVRQDLIFLAALVLPLDVAEPWLREVADGGARFTPGDVEDALVALAFAGSPSAAAAFERRASEPATAEVRRIVDGPEDHEAIAKAGTSAARNVLRSYRAIEAFAREPYFKMTALLATHWASRKAGFGGMLGFTAAPRRTRRLVERHAGRDGERRPPHRGNLRASRDALPRESPGDLRRRGRRLVATGTPQSLRALAAHPIHARRRRSHAPTPAGDPALPGPSSHLVTSCIENDSHYAPGIGQGGPVMRVSGSFRTPLLAACTALLALSFSATSARADGEAPAGAADKTDARIDRLERLLLEQSRQIQALREQLATRTPPPSRLPRSQVPPTRPAPATPAAPADDLPAPAPSTATSTPPREVLLTQPRLERTSHGLAGLRWGGYASLEYTGGTDRNAHFDVHRMVLQFDGQVTDCIDVQGEIEFEHGGIGGGTRDGDVELEQFAFAWHLSDAFNLKIGAPLVPFGRYNLYHDDPINDFTVRPWVARYMVPTGYAEPGVGVFGSWQVGCGSFSYDILLSNGLADGFTNSGGVRGSRHSWKSDNNENKQLWGRFAYTQARGFFDYLEAGLSGTWGRYDNAGDNDLFGFAADLLLRKGPFEFQGEYYRYDIERDALDPVAAVRGMDALRLEMAYHFFPCSWRPCKNCLVQDTSLFTLALRYQTMDLDDRVRGASFNDDAQGWTVGLNYRLNERTVVRIDHQWILPENADDERAWSLSLSSYF